MKTTLTVKHIEDFTLGVHQKVSFSLHDNCSFLGCLYSIQVGIMSKTAKAALANSSFTVLYRLFYHKRCNNFQNLIILKIPLDK
jgi:hypothetical protein